MSQLVWYPLGLGTIEAWHREGGADARCVVRIENQPDGFRVTAQRYHTSADRPIAVSLQYGAFSLEDAKRFAELIESEFPIVDADAPTPAEVLRFHARLSPQRCQFVHAWAYGAGDDAVCACGGITKGYARSLGLRVPA